MILSKYKRCWCLRLWKWNNTIIELVYSPKNYCVPQHRHPNIQIEVYPIFGLATFTRYDLNEIKDVQIYPWSMFKFRAFSVPFNRPHDFRTYGLPLLFINKEVWKTKPTSAAMDFNLT